MAAEGEICVSDVMLALLREGRDGEPRPPGATAETFAEIVLGTIYATTLEWIHRVDYEFDARVERASRSGGHPNRPTMASRNRTPVLGRDRRPERPAR